MHRRPEGNISGDSPQIVAYGFFGCGLMWGANYLEDVADFGGSPFPIEGKIKDFLSFVSNEGTDHLLKEKNQRVETRVMSAVWLTQALVQLDPSLDVVLRSAYRLSKRCTMGKWEGGEDGAHLRFLFFLGLVAAGLKIPEVSLKRGFTG